MNSLIVAVSKLLLYSVTAVFSVVFAFAVVATPIVVSLAAIKFLFN